MYTASLVAGLLQSSEKFATFFHTRRVLLMIQISILKVWLWKLSALHNVAGADISEVAKLKVAQFLY